MRKRFNIPSVTKPIVIKLNDNEKDNINCRLIGKIGLCGSRCYLFQQNKCKNCEIKIYQYYKQLTFNINVVYLQYQKIKNYIWEIIRNMVI